MVTSERTQIDLSTTTLRPKTLEHAYGFDDVAIVPGAVTTNPEMVTPEFTLGDHTFAIPVIASAMDGVVDPAFAVRISKHGGMGVLNLDGVWTRYEDADAILQEIAAADLETSTKIIQRVYQEPVKDYLVGQRVEEIKRAGGIAAVSCTPQNTKKFAPITKDAGVDCFVVASTVTTARHVSRSLKGLRLDELVASMKGVPILVGNTVDFTATIELMETGIHAVLIGVGPGAACTSREVLGIGMPQVSATIETAYARDVYFEKTGRYVPIITDGGIRTGGDVCKSFASGADAVMIGTPLAQATEAPGRGFNWGMATPHASLPRGTRIQVGTRGSLEKILFGPSHRTDGTENLVGALQISMGMVGAKDIREMHRAELIYAPAIKTEGKIFQMQGLGSK